MSETNSTRRPMSFWEALGAMFLSPLACESSTSKEDLADTVAEDATNGTAEVADSFVSPSQDKIYVPHIVEKIDPQAKKEWAVLFYIAGDNNLQPYVLIDINKLEKLGSTDNMHVAVMADVNSFPDFDPRPKMPGVQSTAYIHIQMDTNTAQSVKDKTIFSDVLVKPEANTGSAEALGGFLDWAKTTFPANRYYLVIWGHGGGWKGVASDDIPNLTAPGKDRLTMAELLQGLNSGPDLSVISFMSCMMAEISVAYQIKDKADYMVASQDIVWSGTWGSWPWDTILKELDKAPKMPSADVARLTVIETGETYKGDPNHTYSAISLKDVPALVTPLTYFANHLKLGLESYGTAIDDPKDNVQAVIRDMLKEKKKDKFVLDGFPTKFDSPFSGGDPAPDFRDILNFATRVQANNQIANQWKNKAGDVITAFANVVIEKSNGENHLGSGNDVGAGGLSVYFPLAHTFSEKKALNISLVSAYDSPLSASWDPAQIELFAADDDPTAGANHPYAPASLAFTSASQWDEFLNRYYNPAAGASCNGFDSCQAAPGQTVMLSAVGSSDSDGEIKQYCWDIETWENTDDSDSDKDNIDENDDDCERNEKTIDFTCPFDVAGVNYLFRLMVQDDHNKVAGNGTHFQIDDTTVSVTCIEPM